MAIDSEFLLRIRSGDMASVQSEIRGLATRWLEAGRIDQANRLVSALLETGRIPQFFLDCFEVPWALTGTRPARAPAPRASIEDIELGMWELFAFKNSAEGFVDRIKNANIDKLSDLDLVARAMLMAYDGDRPGHVAAPERIAETLERFFDSGSRFRTWEAWTARVLLALRQGDVERAKTHLVDMTREGQPVIVLLSDRTVAEIVLSGLLAPVLNVTPQQCEEDLRHIEQAIAARLKNGGAPPYADLTWRQLVSKIQDWEGRKATRGAAGATAIAEAEQRLGVTLPQSYRAFLQATNGLKKYSPVGVELWTVGKIGWVRDADRTLLDFYEMTGLEDVAQRIRKSLLIGSEPDGTERLLLVPADDPAAEWQCWFFAHWHAGEVRHPTFRAFIESEILSNPTVGWSPRGLPLTS
jgi:hypothetical protein